MADNDNQNQNQIDQYQLVNCIATGGISQIWEVKHIANQQQFAMKLLLPEHIKDSHKKSELKSEATIARQLEHPSIIKVVDISIGRDNSYFIMEHFRGNNMKNAIRFDHSTVQGRSKKIMELLAQAFAFIHDKGWVHKDIKPDNVLVNKAGDVRVIDFSLASKPTGFISSMLTRKSSVVIQGTRTYLAPELIQRQPLTFSADIYSLGILFYEMLTGRPPFIMSNPNDLLMAHVREKAERPSGYNPNLSPELDQFIFKMIAKKPSERFGSMHEVYSAVRTLRAFVEDPETFLRNKASKDEADYQDSVASTLDSRADATRTPEEREKARIEAQKTKDALYGKRKKALEKEAAKAPPAKTAPTQPAPMPMQPQMMQPMMPQMPFPGQMGMPMGFPGPGGFPGMPGMPFPGQMPGMMPGMMPGQAPMPGMYPGQPMPGMPVPGMPMPGMPMPGMPGGMPGVPQPMGSPQPLRPAAPAPISGPATQAPGQVPPAPKPATPKPTEDLPLMDMGDLDIM